MDLLKDYNYVPETDHYETSFIDYIEESFSPLTNFFKAGTEDYDFMDLLHDKGYIPTPSNNSVWIASNDNDIVIQVAS
jgi:hypothetical protein